MSETTTGHLLDLLAVTKKWTQCPEGVVSHAMWEPGTARLKDRLEWAVPYLSEVVRVCGCDPDRGGAGCWHKYRECWGKFAEAAPEWWWDVLTDRPRAQQTEEAPTLF